MKAGEIKEEGKKKGKLLVLKIKIAPAAHEGYFGFGATADPLKARH